MAATPCIYKCKSYSVKWKHFASVVFTLASVFNGVRSIFTDCGGQLTDQAGVILSPNFPNNYPNDARCSWNITVAPNQIIDFRFKKLDLDRYFDQSCADTVVVHDGPNAQYRILGLYSYNCGFSDDRQVVNMMFRSTSNRMYITFYSDSQNSRMGFSASYWAHDCPPFKYGIELCNTSCVCNQNNSLYCVNYNGACACKSGWTSADCTVDIDECKDPNKCQDSYSTCVNTLGGFICQCKDGLAKNSNGECQDSEQCTQKKCSHVCGVTSTNETLETCYCPNGMKLDPADNVTCIECDNWTYGEDCKYTANCSPSNSKSYNKANGLCSCYLNFTSPDCTQDVNECGLEKPPCSPAINKAQCYNTHGSFICRCYDGYEELNETTCEACGKVLTASSGTIVSNYRAGYSKMECNWIIRTLNGSVISLSFKRLNLWYSTESYFETHPAYIEVFDGGNSNSTLLALIHGGPSEPNGIIRSSGNEMYIVQYSGNYSYLSGWSLVSSNKFEATYWSQECQPFTFGSNCTQPCTCDLNKTQYCNSTNGQCICKPGWTSANCSVDIDECFENPLSCPDYSVCTNNNGSFQCSCKEGLTLINGSCTVNAAAICSKTNCSHLCVNLVQNGQNYEQCYCPVGMELNGDQCLVCKNNRFGPDCYRDCECVQNNTLSCDSRTGICTCLPLWKGKYCSTDFDVCTPYSRNECQKYANCTDTRLKGYRCRCSQVDGYIESANGSCVPIECTFVLSNNTGVINSPLYPNNYMNNAFCTWSIKVGEDNVISLRFGSSFYIYYDYSCKSDYLEVYDGETNSSRLIGHYCGQSMPSVIRTRGNQMYVVFKSDWVYSYPGFHGTYTSHGCRDFTFGIDSCNNLCRCVKENTDYCDNVNGECICKPGWTLGDCSQDVNECLGTNNKVCPTNSDCINTIGSYRCDCHLGYQLNTDSGQCEESSECLYKKCSHTCYVVSAGVEKCACPEWLILDKKTQTMCVVPYYPYGRNSTDLMLSSKYTSYNTIFVSHPIYFTFGAAYGHEIYSAAFVSSNGVISFSSDPVPLSGYQDLTKIYRSKQMNIIAPFLTNINHSQGEVYYHLYDKCALKFNNNDKSEPSAMEAIIARAEKDIKGYYNMSSFEVRSVLVVTWDGMQPFNLPIKATDLNTFQALYICGWETNNVQVSETTYVIFLYQYGLMNWPYIRGRPIFVGSKGYFENRLQDMDTVLVSLLAKARGNTGYNGVMSFKVGHVTGPEQSCKKYLCDHAGLLADPEYLFEIEQLYKCPCTLERLGAQWQLYEKRGPNGDIYCYAISMVAKQRLLKDNKRNMLCCYRWIKTVNADWKEELQSRKEAVYLPSLPESGHVLIASPWNLPYSESNLVLENMKAHWQCCTSSADLCHKFYQIFPDMGCSNFIEFVPASALGDPHITTLDGVTYTMNGKGEYRMLEAENFILQARTDQTETTNGTLTNATVFIAFAAKELNESSFQVELSPSKTSLILFANNVDITNDFYKGSDTDLIMSTTSLQVVREYRINKTLAIATFPSGLSLAVHVAVKSLLIEVNVPITLQNKTQGLLGNFNGNRSDEFMLPNGHILPANLTERQIYLQFAQQWAVTSSDSVFIYGPGESTNTFQDPNFVPMFKDEVNPAQLAEAVKICGDKNDPCIFDYLATGDKAFTQNTKDFREEMEIVIQNLENHPPTIEFKNDSLDNTQHWLVLEGVLSILKTDVADLDNDLVTFEIVDNLTGVSINQTGHIHFMPDISKPILLRVQAKDAKGSYSPYLIIPIAICPSCYGHGVCNNESSILEEFENGWFQIKTCYCIPAYTGKYCESELNACAINPCFSGQTCTDLTAEQQGNYSIGYKCGPCPTGYVAWMETCVDIDECYSNQTCEQTCTNTEGSFMCSCQDGYRLDIADRKSCSDINECEERTSKCQQQCHNNMGNYSCSCFSGYTLDTNYQTCTIKPSQQNVCYECEQVCQVTNSNQVNCSCRIGYEVNAKDPTRCRDIDECQTGKKPCSHVCNNNIGAFECSCYTGYKLATDQISCEACTSPNYGDNCANICQCNSRGLCEPVRGCVCNKQWTGVNCEIDVNECVQPNTCPSGYICENTIGSYNCLCPNGYKLDNGQCADINECTEGKNITCDPSAEVCVNNIGSYSCVCKTGYARNILSTCEDIDECIININECEQICDNRPGTYNCRCYLGFILADDRKACIRVKEDCVVKDMNCSYGCRIDSNNTAICYCPQGYKVNGQGQCEDINECLTDNLNLCANKNGCSNTNGSYTCTCQLGSKLENNGRTCINCSGGTWGVSCSKSCSCGTGADHCDPKTGCVCKTGFTGTLCDHDIDECQTGTLNCTTKEKCVNIPGSAICVCLDGYKQINGICQDINECNLTTSNDCLQVCTNLEGSFTCSCYAGYLYNISSRTCSDINECDSGQFQCEGTCINTEGSHRCSCPNGLFLQPDGIKCAATIPCVNRKDCSYQCASVNGTEKCFCPRASVLAADGIHCDDIDICASSPCKFGCIETQQNTSFECVCDIGEVLAADGISCTGCVEGGWGVSCKNICHCITTNTKQCDKVSGNCECKSGWNGTNCEQDIDECKNTTICTVHTQCKNTEGGFICSCQNGLVKKNASGVCEVCDEGYFGQSCSQKCSCGENFNCNKTNGACYCEIGWNGTNCDVDINECDVGKHTCDISKHEICSNTPGSYQCVCTSGFNRNCTSCSCEDINECNSTNITKCEQVCENTIGSFKCSCKSGYTVSSTDPLKCENDNFYINECNSTQTNICEHVCDNSIGSYQCLCRTGYSSNSTDPSKCEDIDECNDQSISKCEQICTNLDGSYQCSCRNGFVIDSLNTTQCIKLSQYNSSLTFDMNVTGRNLEDKTSDDFKNLKADIESELTIKLKAKSLVVFTVIVTDLRKGSLIVDIIILMHTEGTETSLKNALQDLISDNFKLDNSTVALVMLSIDGNNLDAKTCQVRAMTNPCQDSEYCTVENNVAVCHKKDNDKTNLILGLAIGIPLFVVMCVVIGVTTFCCTKNERKKQLSKSGGKSLHSQPKETQEERYIQVFHTLNKEKRDASSFGSIKNEVQM